MKKLGYLFLLAPCLFLITSCNKNPNTDLISEADARAYMKEHFTGDIAMPKSGYISWDITDNEKKDSALNVINNYKGGTPTTALKDRSSIDNNRLSQYSSAETGGDLENSTKIGTQGTDAVVAMNDKENDGIFMKLRTSLQYKPEDGYNLTYKYGDKNKGLIITSSNSKFTHTRIHTYDDRGRETKFEVNYNKENVIYSATITFAY